MAVDKFGQEIPGMPRNAPPNIEALKKLSVTPEPVTNRKLSPVEQFIELQNKYNQLVLEKIQSQDAMNNQIMQDVMGLARQNLTPIEREAKRAAGVELFTDGQRLFSYSRTTVTANTWYPLYTALDDMRIHYLILNTSSPGNLAIIPPNVTPAVLGFAATTLLTRMNNNPYIIVNAYTTSIQNFDYGKIGYPWPKNWVLYYIAGGGSVNFTMTLSGIKENIPSIALA
jgi:hypothetical protein